MDEEGKKLLRYLLNKIKGEVQFLLDNIDDPNIYNKAATIDAIVKEDLEPLLLGRKK